MKKGKCQQCGEVISGTRRKRFCDSSCRAQHWREQKNASSEDITNAQIRLIGDALKLKDAALEGNWVAISGFNQLDKIMNMLEQEMKLRNNTKARLSRASV